MAAVLEIPQQCAVVGPDIDDEIVLRDAEEGTPVPDYDAYIEKELEPVCDVILPFVGTSFAKIAGRQTALF